MALASAGLLSGSASIVRAQDTVGSPVGSEPAEVLLSYMSGTQLARVARGGRLYDKWWAELGKGAPKGTHPAYPGTGKKSGSATWRCKECHGWDHRGRTGAYGEGSHYTGIGGTLGMMNRLPEEAVMVMTDATHGYDKVLGPADLQALAWYLTKSQIVHIERYIDDESRHVNGNPFQGGRVFLSICARCHGEDGKLINFKAGEYGAGPEYVGTVARKNPWEALHKIRYGHAGQPMPSLLPFGLRVQLDVLAFAQTLPAQ